LFPVAGAKCILGYRLARVHTQVSSDASSGKWESHPGILTVLCEKRTLIWNMYSGCDWWRVTSPRLPENKSTEKYGQERILRNADWETARDKRPLWAERTRKWLCKGGGASSRSVHGSGSCVEMRSLLRTLREVRHCATYSTMAKDGNDAEALRYSHTFHATTVNTNNSRVNVNSLISELSVILVQCVQWARSSPSRCHGDISGGKSGVLTTAAPCCACTAGLTTVAHSTPSFPFYPKVNCRSWVTLYLIGVWYSSRTFPWKRALHLT